MLWDKKATEGPESRVRRELPLHSSCIKERLDCARFMKTWADICLPQSTLIPTLGPHFSPRRMVASKFQHYFYNWISQNILEWPIRAVSLRLWLELCPSLNNWAVKHIVIYRSFLVGAHSGQNSSLCTQPWMRIFHGTCDGEVEHKLWSCIGAKK